MAFYENINPNSGLAGAEFFPRAEGNFAFFYARNPVEKERLKSQLTGLEQTVLDETRVNGQSVLITEGNKSQMELINALESQSDRLRVPSPEQKFHPWKWRGHFSDVGQGLNLYSSIRSGKGLDAPKLMFAGLNLTANWVNKKYGAQRDEDRHQLHYLKEQINEKLKPYLPQGAALPSVDDTRSELRKGPQAQKSVGEKFNDFMKRNSVRVGEIGLRYLGSVFMVLNISQFKKMGEVEAKEAGKTIAKFNWGQAFRTMKGKPVSEAFGLLNKDKTNLYTGGIYLVGKSLGLAFAKAPDPFDPKPDTAFDTFREKYAFRISSAIETAAASTLAIGSIRKKDVIGGLGGASLVAGLTSRFFAPFGIKEVNMKELYAHTVDSLAVMPQDKIPGLLAKTAALLKDHFKEKPITYGQIYTDLRNKLYNENGIAVYADATCSPQLAQESHQSRLSSSIPEPETSYVNKVQQSPQSVLSIS